jgi:TetR/AcrR family transcriptional regulator
LKERANNRAGKSRDAERSKEAILSAAERLFAEHGFEGVSLNEIATTAGLSRGTPSYFFGSKEALYRAVLEGVFGDREEATRQACRPLVHWASAEGAGSIEVPLAEAFDGYLDFLLRRPSFLKLIQREELAEASRLHAVRRDSKAVEESFMAVRKVARQRGLRTFDLNEAVFLFVSLAFFPIAHRSTFMAALGHDLTDPKIRRRHSRFAVDQLLHLLGGDLLS